jgi:transposase InsO family protein
MLYPIFIPTARDLMYLFSVIDIYSRYIIGKGMSNFMDTEWCVSVTKEAIMAHGIPKLVNSDLGSQFFRRGTHKAAQGQGLLCGNGRDREGIIQHLHRKVLASIKYEDIYLKFYRYSLMLYRGY